jgi:hypothetical protein
VPTQSGNELRLAVYPKIGKFGKCMHISATDVSRPLECAEQIGEVRKCFRAL